MNTNTGNKNSRKGKGFTLAEVLITIAILAVLFAVAVPAVGAIKRNLEFRQLDDYARQIFLAAQNGLTAADAAGKTVDFKTLSDNSSGGGNGTAEKEKWYAKGSSEINAILPAGSIEGTVAAGEYAVKVNFNSSTVTAVVFSDRDGTVITTENAENYRVSEGSRKSDFVGKYDSSDLAERKNLSYLPLGVAVRDNEVPEANGTVTHDEKLRLEISLTAFPNQGLRRDKFNATLTSGSYKFDIVFQELDAEGNNAGEPVTVTKFINQEQLDKMSFDSGRTKLETDVLLDSLVAGKQFKDFGTGIKPGADIRITVTASYINQGAAPEYGFLTTKASVITNTLFDSVKYSAGTDGEKTAQVFVANARHLQNLDTLTSGAALSSITGVAGGTGWDVIQSDNIDWSEAIDWSVASENANLTFSPIVNDDIGNYYNTRVEQETPSGAGEPVLDYAIIDNLIIGTADDTVDGASATCSGLFAAVKGTEGGKKQIRNLRLVDTVQNTASGKADYAGAAAGYAEYADLTGCQVYVRPMEAGSAGSYDEYYGDFALESAGRYTGGLVGYASGCEFDRCSASRPLITVTGDAEAEAGGLIGRAVNTGVSSSYADTGFLTQRDNPNKPDEPITDWDGGITVLDESGNAAGTAGGLIGAADNVSASKCYSMGYIVNAENAAGFAGAGGKANTADHCYALMFFNKANLKDRAFGFAPHTAASDSFSGTYKYWKSGNCADRSGSDDAVKRGFFAFDAESQDYNGYFSEEAEEFFRDGFTCRTEATADEYTAYVDKNYHFMQPEAEQNGSASGTAQTAAEAVRHYGDWPFENITEITLPVPEVTLINRETLCAKVTFTFTEEFRTGKTRGDYEDLTVYLDERDTRSSDIDVILTVLDADAAENAGSFTIEGPVTFRYTDVAVDQPAAPSGDAGENGEPAGASGSSGSSGAATAADPVVTGYITIDALSNSDETGRHFRDFAVDKESSTETETVYFVRPGANVKASARVECEKDDENYAFTSEPSEESNVTNSLFGGLFADNKAKIMYCRHLQNLDAETSDFRPGADFTAVQTNDTLYGTETEGNGDLNWRKADAYVFTPITQDRLTGYDGGSHRIDYLRVGEKAEGAGLFCTFGKTGTDCFIKDLSIVNSVFEPLDEGTAPSADAAAGGLAGRTVNTAVSGCQVYYATDGTKDYFYSDGVINSLANDVGGLIGHTSDGSITKSSASFAGLSGVQYVGGLVGRAENTAIKECYADTGLVESRMVENDTDAGTDADAGAEPAAPESAIVYWMGMNSGDTAGGLVGCTAGSTSYKDCYAVGYIQSASVACGFAGKGTAGSVSASDCYSFVSINSDPDSVPSGSAYGFSDGTNPAGTVFWKYGDSKDKDDGVGRAYFAGNADSPWPDGGVWGLDIDNGYTPYCTDLVPKEMEIAKKAGAAEEDYYRPNGLKGLPHYGDWMVEDGFNVQVIFVDGENKTEFKLENKAAADSDYTIAELAKYGYEEGCDVVVNIGGDNNSYVAKSVNDIKALSDKVALTDTETEKSLLIKGDIIGGGITVTITKTRWNLIYNVSDGASPELDKISWLGKPLSDDANEDGFYSCSYIYRYGTEVLPSMSSAEDSETLNVRIIEPTADGYRFAGWYTDRELTAPVSDDNPGRIVNDTPLYPKWVKDADTATVKIIGAEHGLDSPLYVGYPFNPGEWNSRAVGISSISALYGSEVTPEMITVIVNGDVMGSDYYTFSSDIIDIARTTDDTVIVIGQRVIRYDMNGKTVSGTALDIDTSAGSRTLIKSDGTPYVEVMSSVSSVLPAAGEGGEVTVPKGYVFVGWSEYQSGKDSSGQDSIISEYTFDDDEYSVTLFAIRRPAEYRVRFNSNMPAGAPETAEVEGSMDDQQMEYDSEYNLTKNGFSLLGYKFKGWNTLAKPTDKNPGTSYADEAAVINLTAEDGAAVDLYACWETVVYPIQYQNINTAGGDRNDNPKNYTIETDSFEFNEPERANYEFGGWFRDKDFIDGPVEGIERGSTGSVELFAMWIPKRYTITFVYLADSEGEDIVYKTEMFTVEDYPAEGETGKEDLTEALFPTADEMNGRNGDNLFKGWYEKNDKRQLIGNEITSAKGRTADFTVYAKWIPGCYYVNFLGGGATGGKMERQSIEPNKWTPLSENKFTRTGYEFTGWKNSTDRYDEEGADGNGTVYADKQRVYNLASAGNAVDMTALWQPIDYAVNFDANTPDEAPLPAEGTMAGQSMRYGSEYSYRLRENAFSLQGYTFDGWNTKADGTGTEYRNMQQVTVAGLFDVTAENPETTLTLYARWKPDSPYHVSYNLNGGVGTVPSGIDAAVNQEFEIASSEGLTKTDCSFNCWNTKADGTGTSYQAGAQVMNLAAPGRTVTLYAQWSKNTFTVVYNANGGSGTTAPQTVVCGEQVTLRGNGFSRAGYSFEGWNTAADGSGVTYNPGTRHTFSTGAGGTVEFYAKWSQKKLTLSYNANGGSGSMASEEFVSGDNIILTQNGFTREGYSFSGWAESPDGAVVYSDGAAVSGLTGSVTLYAKWSLDVRTVTVNYVAAYPSDAAGTSGSTASQIVTGSGSVSLRTSGFSCSNYRFTGWKVSNSGNLLAPGTEYTPPAGTAAVTMYAQWEKNTYNIKYYANNGSSDTRTVTVERDKYVLLEENQFRNGSRKFLGWSSSENGSVEYQDEAPVINLASAGGEKKLYAKWETVGTYTVSYNKNNGSGTTPSSQSVAAGGSVVLSNASGIYKNNNQFAGWKPNNSGDVIYAAGSDYTPAGNVTMYAQWTGNNAKIVYYYDGITDKAQLEQIASSSKVTLLSNPFTREGYRFTGWKKNNSGSLLQPGSSVSINNNDRFYAQWVSAEQSTVVYHSNGGSGTMENQIVYRGTDASLNANAFARDGYCFEGWSTSQGGSKTYSDGQSVSIPADAPATIDLYAVWGRYTITYHTNHPDGKNERTDNSQNGTGTVQLKSMSALGWSTEYSYYYLWTRNVKFVGWSTGSSASSATYSDCAEIDLNRNMDLYAVWSDSTKKITYNANGGQGTMPVQYADYYEGWLKAYYRAVLLPCLFTRSGYVFDGWAESSGGSVSKQPGDTVEITGEKTYYAHWAEARTVTFDANGGSGSMTQLTAAKNSSISLPQNGFTPPTGYTFTGWKVNNQGGTLAAGASYTLASNVTIYAQWQINGYTVRYDGNGATSGAAPADVITADMDAAVTVSDKGNLQKTGCTFAGWNTLANGTGIAYAPGETAHRMASAAGGTVTLYAQWLPDTLKIVYNGNGADGGTSMADQPFVSGDRVRLNANTFARTGYVFDGWAAESETAEVAYSDGEVIESLARSSDLDLYAKWSPNTYTLSYYNGTALLETLYPTVNEEVTIRGAGELRKTGYTFAGWNTAANGTGTAYAAGETASNLAAPGGEVKLYAQWTQNTLSIRYHANASGVTGTMADQTFVSGDKVKLTANAFIRSGYTFAGWAQTASGEAVYPDEQVFEPLTGTSDLDLYAKWTQNTYTISYDANGGEFITGKTAADASQTVACGSASVTFKEQLYSRDGLAFDGWCIDAFGIGTAYPAGTAAAVSADLASVGGTAVLYAKWVNNKYTVVFNGNGADGLSDGGSAAPYSQTFTVGNMTETLPANRFVRSGYAFMGWDYRPDAYTYDPDNPDNTGDNRYVPARGGEAGTAAAFTEADGAYAGGVITLYAQWKPVSYFIEFVPGAPGCKGSMPRQVMPFTGYPVELNKNEEPSGVFKITREGYVFDGWMDSENRRYDDGQAIAEVMTFVKDYDAAVPVQVPVYPGEIVSLVAQWIEKGLTIEFYGNYEGCTQTMPDQNIKTDVTEKVSKNTFTRPNYTFSGWKDADGTEYADECEFTGTAATVIKLYAQWTPNQYAITYKDKGDAAYSGSNLSSLPVLHTYDVTTALEDGVKADNFFEGWYLNAECTEDKKVTELAAEAFSAPVTLYAKWRAMPVPEITVHGDELDGDVGENLAGTLTADVSIPVLSNSPAGASYAVKVTVYDAADSTMYTVLDKDIGGNAFSYSPESGAEFTILLDSLESGKHFSDICPAITPGADIRIECVLECTLSGTDVKRGVGNENTNSLFAYAHDGEADNAVSVAKISNPRHLQNLATAVSSVNNTGKGVAVTATSAVQYADINWSHAGAASFVPVTDASLVSYDGQHFEVSEIVVNTNGSAGLFGDVANSLTVSNLTLNNCSIASTEGNAGTLAGTVSGSLATNQVLVLYSQNEPGVIAADNAGGLIGAASGNVKVEHSAASVDVEAEGGDAGGIIGSHTAGSLVITQSYSGGHTYNGKYVGSYNVTSLSGAAGGLVGSAEASLTVTESFSTSSVSGVTAGGGIAGQVSCNATVSTAYAVAPVFGVKTDIEDRSGVDGNSVYGGFVGVVAAGKKMTCTACYYLPEAYSGTWTMSRDKKTCSVAYVGSGLLESTDENPPVQLAQYEKDEDGNQISAKRKPGTMQVSTTTYDSYLNSREYPFSVYTLFESERRFYGDWQPVINEAAEEHTLYYYYAHPAYNNDVRRVEDPRSNTQTIIRGRDNQVLTPYLTPYAAYSVAYWDIWDYSAYTDSGTVTVLASGLLSEKGQLTIPKDCSGTDIMAVAYYEPKPDTASVFFYFPRYSGGALTGEMEYISSVAVDTSGETLKTLNDISKPSRVYNGYVFEGWYKNWSEEDGLTDRFSEEDLAQAVTGRVNMYARYIIREEYNITVDIMYQIPGEETPSGASVPIYRVDDPDSQLKIPRTRIGTVETTTHDLPTSIFNYYKGFDFKAGVYDENEPDKCRSGGGIVLDMTNGKITVTAGDEAHFIVIFEDKTKLSEFRNYTVWYRLLNSSSGADDYLTNYSETSSFEYDRYGSSFKAPVLNGRCIPSVVPDKLTGFTCTTDISMLTVDSDNARVYLEYERNTHELSFDSKSGSYVNPVGDVPVGKDVSAIINAADRKPSRPGYSFDGWTLYSKGEEKNPAKARTNTLMPDSNLVAVASWKADKASFRVMYWAENADDAGYSYVGCQTIQSTTGAKHSSGDRGIKDYVPAGFSTESKYFTYNSDRAETITVKGDSSSILNVYLKRNTYTLTFKANSRTVHTITAKYNASIADEFTTGKLSGYQGYSWTATTTAVYAYALQTLDRMPGANVTFNGSNRGTTKAIKYFLEVADGETYSQTYKSGIAGDDKTYYLYKTVRHNFNYITPDEEFHTIEGFDRYGFYGLRNNSGSAGYYEYKTSDTKYGFTTSGSMKYTNELYYSRKSYNLEFYYTDGSTAKPTQRVKYESSLSDCSGYPANNTGLENAVFTGWYRDSGLTQEFDFENEKMPLGGLALYGEWREQPRTVSFYLTDAAAAAGSNPWKKVVCTGTDISADITVTSGDIKPEYTPTAADAGLEDDMIFDGWYYLNGGTETRFISSLRIWNDMSVYAKWEKKNPEIVTEKRTVNVYYIYIDKNGIEHELHAPTSTEEYVGSVIAIRPVEVDGYFSNLPVQSYTVSASVNQSVRFEYTLIEPWNYSVEYYVRYKNYETPGEDLSGYGIAQDEASYLISRTTDIEAVTQYQIVLFEQPAGFDGYRLAFCDYNGVQSSGDSVTINANCRLVKFFIEPDPLEIHLENQYATYDGTSKAVPSVEKAPVNHAGIVTTTEKNIYRYFVDGSAVTSAVDYGSYTIHGAVLLDVTGQSTTDTEPVSRTFLIFTDNGGELKIAPKIIRVSSKSAEWLYDGQIHKYDNTGEMTKKDCIVIESEDADGNRVYYYPFAPDGEKGTSPFAAGEGVDIEFTVDSFRQAPGIAENSYSCTLTSERPDGLGSLENNYSVVTQIGTLKVYWNYRIEFKDSSSGEDITPEAYRTVFTSLNDTETFSFGDLIREAFAKEGDYTVKGFECNAAESYGRDSVTMRGRTDRETTVLTLKLEGQSNVNQEPAEPSEPAEPGQQTMSMMSMAALPDAVPVQEDAADADDIAEPEADTAEPAENVPEEAADAEPEPAAEETEPEDDTTENSVPENAEIVYVDFNEEQLDDEAEQLDLQLEEEILAFDNALDRLLAVKAVRCTEEDSAAVMSAFPNAEGIIRDLRYQSEMSAYYIAHHYGSTEKDVPFEVPAGRAVYLRLEGCGTDYPVSAEADPIFDVAVSEFDGEFYLMIAASESAQDMSGIVAVNATVGAGESFPATDVRVADILIGVTEENSFVPVSGGIAAAPVPEEPVIVGPKPDDSDDNSDADSGSDAAGESGSGSGGASGDGTSESTEPDNSTEA